MTEIPFPDGDLDWDLGSLYVAAFAHELEVTPAPQSGEFAEQALTC